MSSVDYEIEIMAKSPFVKTLALAVIRNILSQKISYDEKDVIDADLIPRFSKKVALAYLKEEKTKPEEKLISPIPVVPQVPQPLSSAQRFVRPRFIPVLRRMPVQIAPSAVRQQGVVGNYGKITPLLNDPSVSSIECPGPDKPLIIIRTGQKQFTKISLNKSEIRDIFEEIAEKARVPFMEGVFRAAVENFSINGIVSEIIQSRFVIKKQTPYALLEERR